MKKPPTVQVDSDYFYIYNYKFNHEGHFMIEQQYKFIKSSTRDRHLLFKKLFGSNVCLICITIMREITHTSITTEMAAKMHKSTSGNNHHSHLTRKMHNPQRWLEQPKTATVDSTIKSAISTSNIQSNPNSGALVLDKDLKESFAEQLRWALVKDLSNGIISAEALSDSILAKVSFKQVKSKVPVGATIINNLISCFTVVLKKLSIELKRAKCIVGIKDLANSGSNKTSYLGLSLTYLLENCKFSDVEYQSKTDCLQKMECAVELEVKTRVVTLCPLNNLKRHNADSIRQIIVSILTETYETNPNRLFLLFGDNAAVNSKTARLLGAQFVGCLAHTLNLTIKDILTGDEFGELEELQVKVNPRYNIYICRCLK